MIDIAALSKQTGVPAHTLRYYEKRGLIVSTGRIGLKRVYPDSVLTALSLIGLGKQAGFTLDEINHVFNLTGEVEVDRKAFVAKSHDIKQHIAQLQLLDQMLEHIVACPHAKHLECERFQEILSNAWQANAGNGHLSHN